MDETPHHNPLTASQIADETLRHNGNERYARQIGLPEIGEGGQKKLRAARVLLVGVGGLGAPISLYLTGAGIGQLGIIDDDCVSVSNLHRQVLYTESEVGQSKAVCAARRLRSLNSEVEIRPYDIRLTADNAASIIADYDIVVDGCDNYETRYLVGDVTARLCRPYVYGAVCGFEGQAAVFNVGECPRHYRDLYPTPPPVPTDKSLVGMTPAVVGSVLAHEVLKLVCGYDSPLSSRLWTIDLRTMQSFVLAL